MLWTMYEPFIVKGLVRNGYSALQAVAMVKEKHPAAKNILLREIKERPVMVNRAPTLHRHNIVGAFPVPVAGKTIRVNPFIENLQNLDYDGDTLMLHAPVGREAVEEVKGMTLSNQLYSDKSKKDLLVFPQHEAVMGIAHAAQADDKNKPVKFKTQAEAKTAYQAGKIGLGTRVEIGD
jgi:DNA-directed RNA polymerase subunit beta'